MRRNLCAVTWVMVLILAFTTAVSAVDFWKYDHYRYGGMDLAIYTNVLWHLSGKGEGKIVSPLPTGTVLPLPEGEREGVGAGGSWGWGNWYPSIQGGSYLGDHVEPVLLLLIPFFRLWSDPRLLLILQAFALGLTVVPVYLLFRFALNRASGRLSPPTPPPHAMGKWGGGKRIFLQGERGAMGWQNNFSPSPPRGEEGQGGRGAIVLAMLWLFNPLMWNAALFEFHALSFAPLFLLCAAYAYLRRRFGWFLLFLLLSLSVREDIALIVVMFGIVAAVGRWRGVFSVPVIFPPSVGRGSDLSLEAQRAKWERGWGWILTPLLFSIAWFVIATRIAAAHSPSGAYKFLVYYGWLRDAASHPLSLLRHFLSIGNLDMVLGLLLPFLFLPLLPLFNWMLRRIDDLRAKLRRSGRGEGLCPALRDEEASDLGGGGRGRETPGGVSLMWLLLALPPLLQILLAEPGGSNVVIELHYGLLFLPALALASIEAINNISPLPDRRGSERGRDSSRWFRWLQRRFPLPRQFAIGLGIATYLAAAWLLGPFPGIANAAIRGASADERIRAAAYDDLLAHVPPDAPIAAGYAALPHIAARTHAYALPYAYLGVNQYAFAPYELPDDLRYLLLDQRDALAYAVQFPSVRWSASYAAEGPARLQKIIADGRFGIIAERDGIALLERSAATAASDGIDQRYLAPDHPVRGRLIVDSLRDIVVQRD